VDAREVGSAAATLAAEREGVDAGGRLGGLEREDGIVGGSIWFISGSWEARFGLFPSSSMSNFCSLAWGFFTVSSRTVFQFFYTGVGGEDVPGSNHL
jgi:hypothetical protein